jgi:hypothetical protein
MYQELSGSVIAVLGFGSAIAKRSVGIAFWRFGGCDSEALRRNRLLRMWECDSEALRRNRCLGMLGCDSEALRRNRCLGMLGCDRCFGVWGCDLFWGVGVRSLLGCGSAIAVFQST